MVAAQAGHALLPRGAPWSGHGRSADFDARTCLVLVHGASGDTLFASVDVRIYI
jgi:hypothetical protein